MDRSLREGLTYVGSFVVVACLILYGHTFGLVLAVSAGVSFGLLGASEVKRLHGRFGDQQDQIRVLREKADAAQVDVDRLNSVIGRSEPEEADQIGSLREELVRLSKIVGVCGLEGFALLVRSANSSDSEDTYAGVWYTSGSHYGPLGNTLEFVRKVIQGLCKQADGDQRETFRLMDAVNRIDPQALRAFDDIVYAYDHGERQRSTYEPSFKRLEDEISKLKQEIISIKGSRPSFG